MASPRARNIEKLKTNSRRMQDEYGPFGAVLALRACYEQYETLFQGRTPRRLQIFNQDGSVPVPQNFTAS